MVPQVFSKLEACIYSYDSNTEHSDPNPEPTNDMMIDFEQNGFILIRHLLDTSETDKLLQSQQLAFSKHRMPTHIDAVPMAFWNAPGHDVVGAAAQCSKLMGVAQKLLNRGEVYLYHGKTVMKEPNTQGVLRWHQDYGYWYYNGCARPDMLTTITALTESKTVNGGLQVVAGSNRCGRLDHCQVGGGKGKVAQMQTDPERMQMLHKQLRTIDINMQPGDTVFLHSNTLHASGQNTSAHARWHLLFAYNAADNCPRVKHHHACYGEHENKLLPATSIKRCTRIEMDDSHAYMTPDQNPFVDADDTGDKPGIRMDH